ncbi:FAD/NAD(P)-binding domain-containing protein [Acephala macrosclerotiorum]|nr:FAD/NAD(P)-binding domain-containing protein [Acephala macrosclerotiorum]
MPQAAHPQEILIVGAGLRGLAAGLALRTDGQSHHYRLCTRIRRGTPQNYAQQTSPNILQTGARIRVPPNSSRLLLRWGVDLEKMKKSASQRYYFIRWEDGSTITKFPFDNIVEEHSAPYYLVHRADLHAALLEAAEKSGVQIHKSQRVIEYDFDAPSAKTLDGKVWKAGLVIGADGIKSIARPLLTGQADIPRDTGDVAYRFSFPERTSSKTLSLQAFPLTIGVLMWRGKGIRERSGDPGWSRD